MGAVGAGTVYWQSFASWYEVPVLFKSVTVLIYFIDQLYYLSPINIF